MISYLQTSKVAVFRDNFIFCSIDSFFFFFLLFRFISMRTRLSEFFSLLMHSAQISNAVVSNILIFRGRRKADCHRNRLQVWVSNQHWFEEIIRKSCVGFGTEQIRMNLDSFQELCRVLSLRYALPCLLPCDGKQHLILHGYDTFGK